ncbi:hypothetical protein DFJ77DRAFT_217299 [Powellomyces hirtus]|nr:hypothetical protein DFJ77DRAFT_217299 [Powellomyces hirtus]
MHWNAHYPPPSVIQMGATVLGTSVVALPTLVVQTAAQLEAQLARIITSLGQSFHFTRPPSNDSHGDIRMQDMPVVPLDDNSATGFSTSSLRGSSEPACGVDYTVENRMNLVVDTSALDAVKAAVAPLSSVQAVYTQYDLICFAHKLDKNEGRSFLSGAFSATGPVSVTYAKALDAARSSWVGYHGRVPLSNGNNTVGFAAAYSVPSPLTPNAPQEFLFTVDTQKLNADGSVAGALSIADLLAGLGYGDIIESILPPGDDSWHQQVLNNLRIEVGAIS